MANETKPTALRKLRAAVTEDGKLLPLDVIANKGVVALFAWMIGLAGAAILLLIIMSSPIIMAIIGTGAALFFYHRKYGTRLPPTVADALEQRRVSRESSAEPKAPAVKRGTSPRSDRSLKS